jgi:hypothetical protein
MKPTAIALLAIVAMAFASPAAAQSPGNITPSFNFPIPPGQQTPNFIGLWDGIIIGGPNLTSTNNGRTYKMSATKENDGTYQIRQFMTWEATCNEVGASWHAVGDAIVEDGELISDNLTWVCGTKTPVVYPSTFVVDRQNGTVEQFDDNKRLVGILHKISTP